MNVQLPVPTESATRVPARFEAADADAIDLGRLVRRVWQRKWIIVLAGLVGALLAAALVSTMTPLYSARALILLDPRERQITSSEQVVSDLKLSNPVIESQVAVIRSNVLLRSAVVALGVDQLASLDPANDVEPVWRTRMRETTASVRNWLGFGSDDPVVQTGQGAAAKAGLDVLRGEIATVRRIVQRIKRDLSVRQLGSSYVISISMTNEDPVLVADVSNAIAEQYIQAQLDERVSTTQRATLWLEDRVGDLRAQVLDAENEVEAYKAERFLVDGVGSEVAARQAGEVSSQLAIARADLAAAQARVDQVRGAIERDGQTAAADVLTSPLVASLRQQRADLLSERAELSSRFGPSNPQIARIAAQVEQVENALAAEVSNIVDVYETEAEVARIRVRSLEESLVGLEEQVLGVSRASVDLRQLEREAGALRDVYEALLARLKETRSQVALPEAQARIVETAEVPVQPQSPRTKLLIAFGGAVGLMLGLGTVFFLEMGARGFVTVQDLESEAGLPVLTALPRVRRKGHKAIMKALAERKLPDLEAAMRQLRTRILFGVREHGSHAVLVTSSLAGEGKTTTALALSRTMAMMGKSVVLLDLDAHRSNLREAFDWGVRPTPYDLLVGNAQVEEAVLHSQDMGFDAITSASQRGMSDVLTADAISGLVDELKSRYDVVVIDAAPVLAISDALVIGAAVDLVLYLVAWESTPRRAVKRGLSALADVGVQPAGMVMTKVDRKQEAGWGTEGYASY